jgi:hypothetical protein
MPRKAKDVRIVRREQDAGQHQLRTLMPEQPTGPPPVPHIDPAQFPEPDSAPRGGEKDQ